MRYFHSTDLLVVAFLWISSLVSDCSAWGWSERLLQGDFFVTFRARFAKCWEVSSFVGVSTVFAIFDLSRILARIPVPVNEMNSVGLFHFVSLTCCHFVCATNIDGFSKSERSFL